MKTVTFYESKRRDANTLHIETDGCIVNIRVGLTMADGRKVTRVDILPEDESRSPDLDGHYWRLADDGCRVIRDAEPNHHEPAPAE